MEREVRGEATDRTGTGEQLYPLIFGRADGGQVDLNVWCFFSGVS